MEYPIKLPPLAVIKAKALAALEAGALQCQQDGFDPSGFVCLYSGPCAIGVALPPEQRSALDHVETEGGDAAIDVLVAEELVAPDAPSDVGVLKAIQNAHDRGDLGHLRALLIT